MATDELIVWGIGTPRTMRANWMMAEFRLDHELRPIRSRGGEIETAEFLAFNPKHKVPVLQHGGMVLTESAAIITYLSETFETPAGFFVPGAGPRRARLNELCFFIMTELDAHLYLLRRHLDLSGLYGEAPKAVASARDTFSDQIGAMVKTWPGDAEFTMEEGMSVADILLGTVLASAKRREIALPGILEDYLGRVTARPAYIKALEINSQGI